MILRGTHEGGIETEIVQAGLAIFEDAMHVHHLQRTNSSNAQWDLKLLTVRRQFSRSVLAGFWDPSEREKRHRYETA